MGEVLALRVQAGLSADRDMRAVTVGGGRPREAEVGNEERTHNHKRWDVVAAQAPHLAQSRNHTGTAAVSVCRGRIGTRAVVGSLGGELIAASRRCACNV